MILGHDQVNQTIRLDTILWGEVVGPELDCHEFIDFTIEALAHDMRSKKKIINHTIYEEKGNI